MSLSSSELEAVDHLRQAWDRPLRLTTVAMALEATGLAARGEARLRIADHLAAHPEIHPVVQRWGVATLVLDEDEKLLGRRLVQMGAGPTVLVGELAEEVGQPEAELERAFHTLQHLELLSWQRDDRRVSYLMTTGWRERLGPLGFNYHSVRLESGERFNVPCAFDFLLLARSELAAERVEIADSCVHCSAKIKAEIDRGRIVQVTPPEAVLFRGGG